MTIKENISVYKCDFCSKKMFVKQAMGRHEERCFKNPANYRPCFNCPHLERKELEFDTGISEYHSAEPIYRKANGFYCAAKKIMLLHPKTAYFEGRNSLNWCQIDGEEVEQFDMPKQCDIFDAEADDFQKMANSLLKM